MKLQMRVKPSRSTRLHMAGFERVGHYNKPRQHYRNADGVRVEAIEPDYTKSKGLWVVIMDRGHGAEVHSKRFNSLGDAQGMMKTLRRQGVNCIANREARV